MDSTAEDMLSSTGISRRLGLLGLAASALLFSSFIGFDSIAQAGGKVIVMILATAIYFWERRKLKKAGVVVKAIFLELPPEKIGNFTRPERNEGERK